MRQVFKTSQGFKLESVPEPALHGDGVLVRVERSLISAGTETAGTGQDGVLEALLKKAHLARAGLLSLARDGVRKTFERTRAHLSGEELVPVGYSCAGTVIARADKEGLPPLGSRVACAGAGIANHAEVVSVPRRLLALVPEPVSWDEAAYATLGAIALHALRRAEAQGGETVVVLGLGLVGLLALELARASGLRVFAFDRDPARVERARALGAELAGAPEDALALVRRASGGEGADRVLLCVASPSSEPTNLAIRLARRKGKVVLVGASGLALEREALFKNEVDLLMSTSYGPGRYDPRYEEDGRDYPLEHVRWTEERNLAEFLGLVARRAVRVQPLTDLVLPLGRAQEAYRALKEVSPRPVGVLLAYGKDGEREPKERLTPRKKTSREKTLAVIGAGEFVRAVHAPLLSGRGFEVAWVANRTAPSAEAARRALSASRATTDWREPLEDPAVGTVLVATRHGAHAEIAARALERGKHVFLEKPAATTREGLALLRAARAQNPGPVFLVGHNRRFAPRALALKDALAKKTGGRQLHYRVSAPFFPRGHWVHEDGGRIVGEGTHFLDLLQFFSGPLSLVAAHAVLGDAGARDSYQALLASKDARALLVYGVAASSELEKEHLSAWVGGEALELSGFRGPGGEEDKGHARLWEELEKALMGAPSLIPEAEASFSATELALAIEERVRGVSR